MRIRSIPLLMCVAVLVLLSACAPGVNEQMNMPNGEGIVAGFWRGLWHGMIAPITFLISLFSEKVQMYEVHNNGGWYDFGFLLGVGAAVGGGPLGRSAGRSRRRGVTAV